MGDVADLVLEGALCEGCGVGMEDPPGHPRLCAECAERPAASLEPEGLEVFVLRPLRTTKAEIDEAVRLYGSVPHGDLPQRYRYPQNEHDFNIAIALQVPRIHPGSGPTYDEAGNLTGWHGFRLKTPEEGGPG